MSESDYPEQNSFAQVLFIIKLLHSCNKMYFNNNNNDDDNDNNSYE